MTELSLKSGGLGPRDQRESQRSMKNTSPSLRQSARSSGKKGSSPPKSSGKSGRTDNRSLSKDS
jgi:hypothetical protein